MRKSCCTVAAVIVALSSSAEVVRDITYVEKGDAYRLERCKLDVRTPDAVTGSPTEVWFHGGGLTVGEKHFLDFSNKEIAQVAVNYRLINATNGVKGADCICDAAEGGFAHGWQFVRDGGSAEIVDIPHDGAIGSDFDLARYASSCGALPYWGHGEYMKVLEVGRDEIAAGTDGWRLAAGEGLALTIQSSEWPEGQQLID